MNKSAGAGTVGGTDSFWVDGQHPWRGAQKCVLVSGAHLPCPTSPPVCPADGPSNAHLLIVFLGSTEITLHFGMDSKRLLASFFLKYIKDSFMLLLRCFFVCFTFVLNLATIFGSSFSSLWVLFYSWRN